MRRKLSYAMIIALMAALAATGCGSKKSTKKSKETETKAAETMEVETTTEAETEENIDNSEYEKYISYYNEILIDNYIYILNNGDGESLHDGKITIKNLIDNYGITACTEMIGYTYEDISGDGIPELIFGIIAGKNNASTEDELISIYSMDGYYPCLVLESTARNSYTILEDNTFYAYGSAGAAYTIYGKYELSKDAKDLVCDNFYFSHEIDGDFENIGYYHNTTGVFDADNSELTDMSDEEFYSLHETLRTNVKKLELTPMTEFGKRFQNCYIDADYVTAEDENDKEIETFVATENENKIGVEITITGDIREFKLLKLEYVEDGIDDLPYFSEEIIYENNDLNNGDKMIAYIDNFETIPKYAVYYIDEFDNIRTFSISEDGQDGSIALNRYQEYVE